MASAPGREPEPEPDDDLAWLAFHYAADALDADQSAAFEDRLEHDQSAREALAEAVPLAVAVAVAASDERRAQRSRQRRSAAVVALTVAALALIAAPRLLAPAVRVARPSEPEAVARAWSGLRQQGMPAIGHDDPADWPDELPLAESPDPRPLPHWLLEAATLPADAGRGTLSRAPRTEDRS